MIIFPQKPHHHHHIVEGYSGGGSYGGGGGGGGSYGGGGGGSYGGGGATYGGGGAMEAITYEPAKGGGADEYSASNLVRMLNRGPQRGVIPLSMSGSENRPVIINANSLRTGGGGSSGLQGMNGFGGMDSTYDLSVSSRHF